jgi:hypothetical protein
MAAERRVAALTRHLANAHDISRRSKLELRDFSAEEVYLFLTRDNVQLRAKMLDFLKASSVDTELFYICVRNINTHIVAELVEPRVNLSIVVAAYCVIF